ncbi:MAG: hypothetical protein ABSH34_08815 [Verrucomicrobiota bacterium]
MKMIRILCLCFWGFVLSQVPSQVCAQSTNPPPLPAVWTNLLHGIANGYSWWGTNVWWTNHTAFTNTAPPPRAATNRYGIIPPGLAPPTTLPRDMQTLLQQFQQQRRQLMNGLQAATDAQRQQVLQQLEQLRDRLQSQLQALTALARDQALDMRGQFGRNFAPGNSSGGGPASSGHGGRPRP